MDTSWLTDSPALYYRWFSGVLLFFSLTLLQVLGRKAQEREEKKRAKKRKRRAGKKKHEFALFLPLPHSTGNPVPEPQATLQVKARVLSIYGQVRLFRSVCLVRLVLLKPDNFLLFLRK
jgi:hypothetical protein